MGFWQSLTAKILIVNVVVYLLTFIPAVFDFLALTPDLAVNHGYVWQFFTYMYVHDTYDPMHIFLNMFSLVMFGPQIERRMGKSKFFLFYTLCGIGAAIFHVLIEGVGTIPLVGASGAIFGVLTAFGLFYPKRIIYFQLFIPMPAIVFIAILAGMQILLGLSGAGSIAFWGHLGGMLVGFILIKVFKFGEIEKPRVTYFWEVE
jgi:membrane associated rhomboid family serine protease